MPLPNAPTQFALNPSDDTGISSSDNVTSKASPTFTGQGLAGAGVTLFDDANHDGIQPVGVHAGNSKPFALMTP